MTTRTTRRLLVITAALFIAHVPFAAAQNPFKKVFGGSGNVKYKLYRDPAGRFEIEYPEKDWRVLPAGSASLAVFSRSDGPAVFVDHVRLTEPLTTGEQEAMPAMEVQRLRNQDLPTKDFKSEPIDTRSGRGVLIRYFRTGRGPESVVHCTVAIGQDLFRLNAVVPEKMFERYEPIVLHMIESFKSPAEPPVAMPTTPAPAK